MKKLSDKEKNKIRAFQDYKKYPETAQYLGNLFYIKNKFPYIEGKFEEILEKRKILTLIGSMAKKEKEVKKEIWEKYKNIQERLIAMSVRIWLGKNLIVQIARPDTWWNKGDYTNDEEKNKYYRKNPLFVKFDNKKEYYEYLRIINDHKNKEKYKKWFKKNKKSFTKLNLK